MSDKLKPTPAPPDWSDPAVRFPQTKFPAPRAPPDNTPSAIDICRYPKMYARQPEVAAQAPREVLGEIVPPEGLDVSSPEGKAKWTELKIAAEKAGLDAGSL